MRHAFDGIGFDDHSPIGIVPDLVLVPISHFRAIRFFTCRVNAAPLIHDLICIPRSHGLIMRSMPHGYSRPRTCVMSGTLQRGPELGGARRISPLHLCERFCNIGRRAIGKSRDDRAARNISG
ncbi:hypothetical protein AJ87_47995 [Rhizobium yanglingense]|nr:hypothetical protein AJ87_47995 [Rhizobium yanglingense]